MSNCAWWLNCNAWICACWVFVETLNVYLQLSTYFWASRLIVQILPPSLALWSTHANSTLLQQIPWATREAGFAKSVKPASIKSHVSDFVELPSLADVPSTPHHLQHSFISHGVSGASCILKLLPRDKEWAMLQREQSSYQACAESWGCRGNLQINGKSKWVTAKLHTCLKCGTPARAEIPQLGEVLLSARALQKTSFLLFILFNSKSQYIKLTLPLNQESGNLAIHLEGNFLVN